MGVKDDPDSGGRIIIDCLMNMPLLFWASEQTGNPKYKDVAIEFVNKAHKFLMRGDDSSSIHFILIKKRVKQFVGLHNKDIKMILLGLGSRRGRSMVLH